MLYTFEDDLRLMFELKVTPLQLSIIQACAKPAGIHPTDWRHVMYRRMMELEAKLKTIGVSDKEMAMAIGDLVGRNILIDFSKPGSKSWDYYEISDEYSDKFMLHYRGMPGELHDLYPHHFISKGTEFYAKNCSEHDIALDYMKAIKKDPEEHKRVMDDLKWAIENDAIKCSLRKFVDSKYWESIRATRQKLQTIEKTPGGELA